MKAQTPPLILVVDDDDNSREVLRKLLEHEGFRVIEAEDGGQAVVRAERERPQLIILDVMMPDVHGATALGRLRAFTGTHAIPVIVHSGVEEELVREKLPEPGVRFMKKPADLPLLLAWIRELVGSPA